MLQQCSSAELLESDLLGCWTIRSIANMPFGALIRTIYLAYYREVTSEGTKKSPSDISHIQGAQHVLLGAEQPQVLHHSEESPCKNEQHGIEEEEELDPRLPRQRGVTSRTSYWSSSPSNAKRSTGTTTTTEEKRRWRQLRQAFLGTECKVDKLQYKACRKSLRFGSSVLAYYHLLGIIDRADPVKYPKSGSSCSRTPLRGILRNEAKKFLVQIVRSPLLWQDWCSRNIKAVWLLWLSYNLLERRIVWVAAFSVTFFVPFCVRPASSVASLWRFVVDGYSQNKGQRGLQLLWSKGHWKEHYKWREA